MYKIDFNNPIHIHFIGIGGISMSGLAKILLSKGFTVSGSDSQQQFTLITLNSRQLRKPVFQCSPVQSFLVRL